MSRAERRRAERSGERRGFGKRAVIAGLVFLSIVVPLTISFTQSTTNWQHGYVLLDEPFDRAALPSTYFIEIYRRRIDSSEWSHGYVPMSWTEAPYKDEMGPHCLKIRAVDENKAPVSEFSAEVCQQRPPTALNVK